MDNIFDIRFLLALYLVQLTSLSNNTLGKQLKEYTYKNRTFQHIVNLVFLFVLISMVDSKSGINQVAVNSLGIYFIYLLSTKLDLQFNLLILGLIIVYHFYTRELKNKKNRIINDSEINNTLKETIVNLDNNKYMLGGIGLVGVLIYLVYLYGTRKNVQYGGGFSYSKFLLG
jgi:hypothetical protein